MHLSIATRVVDVKMEREIHLKDTPYGRPGQKDDILTFKWIKRCHEDVKEEPFQVGGCGVGRLELGGEKRLGAET